MNCFSPYHTANEDYMSETVVIVFNDIRNVGTVSVALVDDNEVEVMERFIGQLLVNGTLPPRVTFAPDLENVTATIIDDDSECYNS